MEEFLRAIGHDAGVTARLQSDELRERVDAAVVLLSELGGLAEVDEQDDAYMIRGFSCPLGAVVSDNPEACKLAEELIAAAVGRDVEECCERAGSARCNFRIAK